MSEQILDLWTSENTSRSGAVAPAKERRSRRVRVLLRRLERIEYTTQREISADVRFGLQVSVEAHGGGGLGVRPGARVVASVDVVSVNGPGSSRTL